jgi:hypothetical protein
MRMRNLKLIKNSSKHIGDSCSFLEKLSNILCGQ